MGLLRILLAILIPPLGVFLTVGPSSALIINILLTLLGWLPGSIHAVWVITKQAERTDTVVREEVERVDERAY